MAQSANPLAVRGLTAATAALAAGLTLGCGLAAAPQPPSLHLPKPVQDLQAERIGNHVHLTWTAPKATTDGLKLTAPVPTHVCVQSTGFACSPVATVTTPQGKAALYDYALPAPLTQGPPRALLVQVEALNAKGKFSAPSNTARTWAGAAPPSVAGLTAQTAPQGVLLRWQPAPLSPGTVLELQRTLLAPPPTTPEAALASQPTTTAPHAQKKSAAPAPQVQTLRVLPLANPAQPGSLRDPGAAIDASILWDATYRYTVARVLQSARSADAAALRIASAPSAAVTLQALDTFPPAAPKGLAAVLISAAMNGGHPAIALSWIASPEVDFAQYRVFRRDPASNAPATQIAPAPNAPANTRIVTPIYQDASIAPGHSYAYSVSAVDIYGNASPRSAEVPVSVSATPSQ